jgi:DNA modification methylase
MSGTWEIFEGDVRERLREMSDGSVHCCITSPPYFGLRDYGTGEWTSGSASCDHLAPMPGGTAASTLGDYDNRLTDEAIRQKVADRRPQYSGECPKCGARRIDQQVGLEETPAEYVEKLVEIFREVRRVLRIDGTLWLNLGDSYARSAGPRKGNFGRSAKGVGIPEDRDSRRVRPWAKEKDLLGIPWTVALALRSDGWFLRSDIIWSKPNPMPESVTDRPTTAHEYVFLLTKSARYFYDAVAIREPDSGTDHVRTVLDRPEPSGGLMAPNRGIRRADGRQGRGRNKRSVWEIATQPYPDAHFATFPPKLIEPMVLAGTPRQACGVCGAPWERVVEITYENPGNRTTTETLGFESACDHDDGSGVGIVLDPFAGSGTTLEVAVANGRRGIGLELNPEYVRLAERRLAGVTPSMFDA